MPSIRFAALAFAGSLVVGCGGGAPLVPDVAGVTFVEVVDNPWYPLPLGATWTYEDGAEQIVVTVLDEEKTIEGVAATVVRDTATVNGVVAEDTRDWFAQDDEGNVWYLGEDTCEYEGGECASTAGSWEWGQDGALPGIVMWADPAVDGVRYYQEYAPGEAEDVGEVVGVGGSVDVAAGSFEECVETRDTSTLETSANERKHYCRGVGLVSVDDAEELVEVSGL